MQFTSRRSFEIPPNHPAPRALTLEVVRERLVRRPPAQVEGAEPGWKRASVAAIFRDAGEDTEVLFIQRASHPGDPWGGQVGFPGGKVEADDPHLRGAAERETAEEVGLELRPPRAAFLGPLDALQARARSRIEPMTIHPHAWTLSGDRPELRLDRTEVADAFWVRLTVLQDPARRVWVHRERAELPWEFPAVDLGPGRLLWGLTFHMIRGVLERLDLATEVDRRSLPRAL